jgi:lipoprotein-releasing system permease protein
MPNARESRGPAPQRSLGLRHYQLYLSLRYLRSRFSALAALLSITFGVAVMLILLGIMGGYSETLRELIRGQESHIIIVGPGPYTITRVARLEVLLHTVPNVRATAPFIETMAMYRTSQFNPCQLRGIQPEKQIEVSNLGECVLRPEELESVLGDLGLLADVTTPPLRSGDPRATEAVDRVLHRPGRKPLGAEEMQRFFQRDFAMDLLERLNPSIVPELEGRAPPALLVGIQLLLDREMLLGQLVTLVTAKAGTGTPNATHFLVAGAFRTGDFELDSKAFTTHVDTLKNMLDLYDPTANSSRWSGVRVLLADLSRLGETTSAIENLLKKSPPYDTLSVHSWEDLRRILLQAVKAEKWVNYFLLVLLLSFASVMVLLMLTLTVIEKTRDIGVLLALGATPGGVTRIFLANGLALSLTGTALGLVSGYVFCLFINPIHDWIFTHTGLRLFDPQIYHMDRIPIAIRVTDIASSVAPPIVFGLLASLVPALWASRRDPIKAIHYA